MLPQRAISHQQRSANLRSAKETKRAVTHCKHNAQLQGICGLGAGSTTWGERFGRGWGGLRVKVSGLHPLPAHSPVLTGAALPLRLASCCQGAGAVTARQQPCPTTAVPSLCLYTGLWTMAHFQHNHRRLSLYRLFFFFFKELAQTWKCLLNPFFLVLQFIAIVWRYT